MIIIDDPYKGEPSQEYLNKLWDYYIEMKKHTPQCMEGDAFRPENTAKTKNCTESGPN